MKILIIEDEKDMVEVITDNLEFEGYSVDSSLDGDDGLNKVQKFKPHLIILDVMLPKKNGIEVCKELRKRNIQTPILFLTARGSEIDRVLGLEIGGDDYLCKPFFMRELLARVKVLLRRYPTAENEEESITIGQAHIDLQRYTAKVGNEITSMSHYEIAIIKLLLTHRGKVVERNTILDEIWGVDSYPSNRTVDNYVVKIRKKIEPNPNKPLHILTVHGVGYKLVSSNHKFL